MNKRRRYKAKRRRREKQRLDKAFLALVRYVPEPETDAEQVR